MPVSTVPTQERLTSGSGLRRGDDLGLSAGVRFFEIALGELSEEAGADREGAVVEVVAGVVQVAAVVARAVADPQHRAGPLAQHVGEILAAERRRDIAVDLAGAADLFRDLTGKS